MSKKSKPVRFDATVNPSVDHTLAIAEGSHLNNLAQRLMGLGRYEEAEPLHKQAIEVKERGLGKDHITTALSYNALGETYIELGRLDEAEIFLQKALDIRQASTRSIDDIDAAVTRENLGVVYEMRGDLPRARQMRRVGAPDNMLCAYNKCELYKVKRRNLLQCGGCKSIYYCGAGCQSKDWKRHKKYCKRDASKQAA
ncbi:hypothetical protein DAEQUDRAFT_697653 [Daedalea quercina L-15889]|uniref:MYND-type domain-containing protein n=1 Tax=Daedalea quercina L-15889 TaxID=1314783 RepID=A0A165M2J0_9APHY|nr:hypothetical protein DAEQUDRAFT_697653 [Daedalea quercina L-15889]